jgi:hypothetical protein
MCGYFPIRKQWLRQLFLFLALGLFIAKPCAAHADPSGVWEGTYTCNQGKTLLQLIILPALDDRHETFFAFKTPPGPDHVSGCFRMNSEPPVASKPIRFRQDGWISRPPGYVMVDLEGLISLQPGIMFGVVYGPNCSVFWLNRARREPELPQECVVLSQ